MHLYEFQRYLIKGGFKDKTSQELTLTDDSLERTINNFDVIVDLNFILNNSIIILSYQEYENFYTTNSIYYKKNNDVYKIINSNNKPEFSRVYEISGGLEENYGNLKEKISQNTDEIITINGITKNVSSDGIVEITENEFIENGLEENIYIITCKKQIGEIYTKNFNSCSYKYKNIYDEENTVDVEYNNNIGSLFSDNLQNGINTRTNTIFTYTYTEERFNKRNRIFSEEIEKKQISGLDGIETAFDLTAFTLKNDLPENFFATTYGGNAIILVDYSKININNRKVSRIKVSNIIASTKLKALINEDTKVPSQDYMNFLEERIKNLETELSNTKTELNNYKLNPILPIGKPANATNGSIWIS